MSTSYTLRVNLDGGGTKDFNIIDSDSLGDSGLPSLSSLEISKIVRRRPEQADSAKAAVYRDAFDDIESSIDRINDKVKILNPSGTAVFGGRFRDWEYQGEVVNIIIDGPKVDAVDGEPSGGNDIYQPQGDDSLVKNELLSRVSTISEGSINQQDSSIPFSEQHASPGKSITTLARDAGAEVQYQPDFSMDYVASLGSDKTGTTLSPSNGNILGSPRKRTQAKEEVTHVRVLGAGEGTQQVQATATISSYSGGRKIYRKHSDKDIQDSSRAQKLADKLVAEYDGDPEWLEVEIGLPPSESPSIGDEYTLDFPDYDINSKTLRIMELTRILDATGERFRCLFSNRDRTRGRDADKQAQSVNSFNEGNAGQYFALADGEGWDAVDSGENYEFSFYRPQNTINEYRAVLQLESREYRLRASQTGHTHSVDVTHPSHNHDVDVTHPSHNHDVSISATSGSNSEFSNIVEAGSQLDGTTTLNDSWQQIVDVGPTNSANSTATHFMIGVDFDADSNNNRPTISVKARLKDSNGNYYPDSTGYFVYVPTGGRDSFIYHFVIAKDVASESIGLEMECNLASGGDAKVTYGHQAVGQHTHDVSKTETSTSELGTTNTETSTSELGTTNSETTASVAGTEAGINTISGEQVSNVSVDVGGTTVKSGLSAPIDETIDITGELSDGSNSITISSDSLGELRATVEFEGLKNANK